MKFLPVALRVENQRVLIVGGGAVAARKARSLLECGAIIQVVAPHCCEELQAQLALTSPRWEYSQRAFQTDDCDNCILVFACTDDAKVNAQIATICEANNIFCQLADDAYGSTLHSAATIRRDEICIGISTGGASPALAKHLKEKVGDCVGEEYSQLLEWMGERREVLKEKNNSQLERAQIWRTVLASGVLPLLREGKKIEAEKMLDNITNLKSAIQNPQSK